MMTDTPQAHAGTYQVQRATITNNGLLGLRLGDLRKIVAASESMPDTAMVRFEKLSKSCVWVDEWHAKRINVEHEG